MFCLEVVASAWVSNIIGNLSGYYMPTPRIAPWHFVAVQVAFFFHFQSVLVASCSFRFSSLNRLLFGLRTFWSLFNPLQTSEQGTDRGRAPGDAWQSSHWLCSNFVGSDSGTCLGKGRTELWEKWDNRLVSCYNATL